MTGSRSRRIDAALQLARDLARKPWRPVARDHAPRERFFAIGDPQASADKFLSILDAWNLLGDDGRLASDVALVSIGDHFDYGTERSSVREIGEEGLAILRWLAEHRPDQVSILAGNHDLSRVQELAWATDETFARARVLALEIRALEKAEQRDEAALADALARFEREPARVPTPEIAARDYSSWSEEQRRLVQALLANGRLRLAQAASTPDGRAVLLTHASIGTRELDVLDVPGSPEPDRIARALNLRLARAVESVRPSWDQGKLAPLDLAPLHVGGANGKEGGGMLYRRPSNPARKGARPLWEKGTALAPRRFDPRDLPRGLAQACGHTSHGKCLLELEGWLAPGVDALPRGALRTIRVNGSGVSYAAGLEAPAAGEAALHMIDSEMNLCGASSYRLLELGGFVA